MCVAAVGCDGEAAGLIGEKVAIDFVDGHELGFTLLFVLLLRLDLDRHSNLRITRNMAYY